MKLGNIAFSRSGDKGNTLDVTLVAREGRNYELLRREVTAEKVKEHLRGLVRGKIERFELPQLNALKFVLHRALDGGVTRSRAVDRHGKTLSAVLLDMEVQSESMLDELSPDDRSQIVLG